MSETVFGGIEKAEVYGSGANIRPGSHLLRIEELLVHRSRTKKGVVFFIAELSVVSSTGGRPTTAKELLEGQASPPLSVPHAVGSKLSWVVDMSLPSALSNAKGFALALAPGCTEADITEESMNELVNNDPGTPEAPKVVQPASGIIVNADAFMILTRKGNDFTKVRWSSPAE